jgi:hypothetical protein
MNEPAREIKVRWRWSFSEGSKIHGVEPPGPGYSSVTLWALPDARERARFSKTKRKRVTQIEDAQHKADNPQYPVMSDPNRTGRDMGADAIVLVGGARNDYAGSRQSGFRQVDLTELFGRVTEAFSDLAEDQGKTIVAEIEPSVSTPPHLSDSPLAHACYASSSLTVPVPRPYGAPLALWSVPVPMVG